MVHALAACLLLLLGCGLAHVCEAATGDVKVVTKPCGADMFEKLDKCCKLPKLLPYEAYKGCSDLLIAAAQKAATAPTTRATTTKKPATKMAAARPRSRSAAVVRSKFSAQAAPQQSRGSLPGGPSCLMECVLRKQNMLMRNDELDVASITAKFVAASDGNWTSTVKDAVTKCAAELSKLGLNSTPASGDKQCKQAPGLLISCVRRYLTLNCPAGYKGTTDTSCTQKVENLKSCDPFSISSDTATSAAPKSG